MTIAGKPLVYLDLNMLIYMRDGKFRLSHPLDVYWTYSEEHFREISRGANTSLLGVLRDLEARQIRLATPDGRSDQAELDPYSCSRLRYEQYIEAINEIPFDFSIFSDFLVRIFGAYNFNDIASLPHRLQTQVEKLVAHAGEQGRTLLADIKRVSAELELAIGKHLIKLNSIQEARAGFGLRDGWGGNTNATDPINEIWEAIKTTVPGISREQFFTGEGLDHTHLFPKSAYFRVIACHTVLNLVGYRPDKSLKETKELTNAMSDASHIGYAAYCDLLISADQRLLAKAKAIYRFLDVPTHVAQYCLGQNKAA